MVCSACGYENQSGHRFCGMCGMPLPHRPLTTPGAQSTIGLTRVPLDSGGNGGTGTLERSQEIHTPAQSAGHVAETMHEAQSPVKEMVPAVSLDEYVKNFRYVPPSDPDEVTMHGEAPSSASQNSAIAEEASAVSPSEEAVAKEIAEVVPAQTSPAETAPEETKPTEVVARSVANEQADEVRGSSATDAIATPEVFPAKDIAIAGEARRTEAAPPTAPVKEMPIVAASAAPVVAADDVRERLGLDASGPAEEPERSRFLDLAKPAPQKRSATSSLVGPSFLGLDDSLPASDSDAVDDDVPEESSTHWRYWMVAAVVLLAVVLGGLQWRAQVNQTAGPLEVVRLKLRKMKGETAPAQSTAMTSPASSGASQPAITVEPQNKSADNAAANGSSTIPAGVLPGAGPSTATNNPAQPPPTSNITSSAPANSNNAAAPVSSNAATTASAKPPTPAVTTSANTPDPKPPAATTNSASGKNSQTAQSTPPKKPAPTDNAKPAKSTSTDNAKTAAKEAVPGDDELAKANNASDSVAEAAWLWKATAKGNPDAPVRLADMYVKGNGVPRSCEQAMVLLKTAATKENARARNRLASMYSTGTCVARNRVEAYRWMSAALAADPNSGWAQQNRESLWNQMTPDERAEAEKYR